MQHFTIWLMQCREIALQTQISDIFLQFKGLKVYQFSSTKTSLYRVHEHQLREIFIGGIMKYQGRI